MTENIDFLLPVKIALIEGDIQNAESLLKNKTKQIGLGENDVAVVCGKARIVLDFGKEIQGGVRILTHYIDDGAPVKIRFGESLSEAVTPIGIKNATNDHSLRDFELTLPQLSDGTYGQTGFRFVCLEFKTGKYRIKSVYAKSVTENHEIIGSFCCNDERINEIYSVSQRTLLLCLQGGMIWDGIKRDRLVWIGDLHPETLGLLYTTGAIKNIENCLDFAAKETAPTDWMNGLTAYSFWWITVLYDYYRFTANKDFVLAHADYLEALIAHTESLIGDDGSTNFPSDFLDWPTSGTEDGAEGVAALCKLACEKAAKLLEIAGKDPAKANLAAAKLSKRKPAALTAKQSIAMNYLAFGKNAEETGKALTESGAHGLSTFMSYYILSAIKQTAGAKAAIDILKEYYGGMLDKGATSFWEDFDVSWIAESGRIDELPKEGQKDIHGDYGKYCYTGFRHSLCHGWSCGAIEFLAENVLGISVTEAGCKKITISPDLGGLEFAKGVFPTPYGKVIISHKRTEKGIISEITVPKDIEITAKACIAEIKRV